ncbi:MAG TPA: hypothetical protein VFQ00_03790, partial [Terriglobales bacterium]|nr:hypothetical protein [Terriglobales bacterium]
EGGRFHVGAGHPQIPDQCGHEEFVVLLLGLQMALSCDLMSKIKADQRGTGRPRPGFDSAVGFAFAFAFASVCLLKLNSCLSAQESC